MIYLIHFEKYFHHCRHYIGYTSKDDVEERFVRHKAGIDFQVVRTWEGGYELERKLKNRKNAKKLCPICRGELCEVAKK